MQNVKSRFIDLYPWFSTLSLVDLACEYQHAHGCTTKTLEFDSESQEATSSHQDHHYVSELLVKVQVLYLACLQTLVKMNPKTFHSEWPRLLGKGDIIKRSIPVEGGLVPLASLVVHGRSSRLRHAAAASISTLIEGPAQRAYLSLGEEQKAIKSFISLSQSLGESIVRNIEALVCCILSESDDLVCCAIIRALTTFLVGCSWDKISQKHFWSSIRILHEKISRYDGMESSNNELLFACLHSLAALFTLKIEPLSSESSAEYLMDNSTGRCLSDRLIVWMMHGRVKTKLEATLAVRGMVRLRLFCMSHIAAFSPILDQAHELLTSPSMDTIQTQNSPIIERLQQQHVLLLGDISEHILKFDGEDKIDCDINMKDICDNVMVPAALHKSSRVRAASFSSLANLPSAFWRHKGLSEKIAKITIEVGTRDSESTVRSNAIKAYGSYIQSINIPEILSHRDLLKPLERSLDDAILAVRIPCAVILEDLSNRMWQSSMEHLGEWKDNICEFHSFSSVLAAFITRVCVDHDKVKVHGMHALGYLIGIRYRTMPAESWVTRSENIISVAFTLLKTNMMEGSLPVQWASYEACRIILLTARLTGSSLDILEENSVAPWREDTFLLSIVDCLEKQRDEISQPPQQPNNKNSNSRTRLLLDQALIEFS